MNEKANRQVTLVERVELKGPPEGFEEAVSALCDRLETENVPGLLTYQFYYNPHAGEGAVIVRVAKGDVFVEYFELINTWEEWAAFRKTAEFSDMRLFGEPGERLEAFLLESKIDYEWGGWHVAGFAR
jgi:hypothetical protein